MHHLGPLSIHQFPCLQDNYGFLVRDNASGTVAAVDTPDAAAIAEAAASLGWTIDLILNTHWHPDHAGGNGALVERLGCHVIAPEAEGEKIAVKHQTVRGGETVMLGATAFKVIDVPGHTMGHIAYYAEDAGAAFVGDTLFSLGCGRMFEGTPEVFWRSILKLRGLPPETWLFCAHEYTAANAKFALSLDGDNAALRARAEDIRALRADNQPTVPVRLVDELAVNPFLRGDDAAMAASLGLAGADPHAVFAEIRARKDQF